MIDERNKFWKGVMTGVLVTAFACLVTVGTSLGIYMFGKRTIDNQVQIQAEGEAAGPAKDGGKKSGLDFEKITDKLTDIQSIVDSEYLFEDQADPEQEEAGIYKGYMYGLNDLYADYYTKDELASFMEETNGTYCGIGAMVSQNRQTGISTIFKVFAGSPAEEAGLLPGDILYAVDGTPVSGEDLTLVINNYIKGEENTDVEITVFREKEDEYKTLKVTRRQVDVQTVETEMLPGNVGYISVTEFDTVTDEQFKTGIENLEKQGMKKMIIDLRNNPGGELETVVSMVDYMIEDNKTIVTVADKRGAQDVRKSKDGHSIDIPVAVLVNGNSASASEVFTGALKDYKTATIVGTTTFGKGIVQSLYPLSDGSAIKLTVAHYYTPNGTDLHGKGIEPDVEVELDEELATMVVVPKDKDNQIQEALKALGEEPKQAGAE